MLRKKKATRLRPAAGQEQEKRDSSRLSPSVINNPVNQAADWSQDAYPLEELVTKFPLPQIVRCASRLVPGEDQHLPVNVYVPMLLCAGRSARKLLAKHVGLEARSSRLTETEDTIVIPSDYEGHFLRLQARTTKDQSAVCSLLQIAQSHTPAFINFTPLTSFTVPNQLMSPNGSSYSNGDSREESQVSSRVSKSSKQQSPPSLSNQTFRHDPGCVFIVTGTQKGLVKDRKRHREIIFLRCTDQDGQEIFIRTDQPGEYVGVEIPPNGGSKLSVLPHNLMETKRFPALVRFVYGHRPPRLTPSSLMFTLVDTFEEDSLIGCLLYPSHALMIEIPMTSSLAFQVAQNRDEVMNLSLPRHAAEVVQERQELFMKDLKLKCKFIFRVTPGFNPIEDDMPSATVRTRQYIDEAFFYL
ncbi:unnamed protein product [Lymnaea stagnalis]|uniref:CABIT domain-containing protein n=1 Tax=Lymnaea stagnalis TaxID=6523 RepID=A0AAV2HM26_LYMST